MLVVVIVVDLALAVFIVVVVAVCLVNYACVGCVCCGGCGINLRIRIHAKQRKKRANKSNLCMKTILMVAPACPSLATSEGMTSFSRFVIQISHILEL